MARFNHPPRGTCIPGCPLYGVCHCGCGGATSLAMAQDPRFGVIRGLSRVFCRGHQIRRGNRRWARWSVNGVPNERIRPLLAFLKKRYGTCHSVASSLGVSTDVVSRHLRGDRANMNPRIAARVAALVLAGQPADREHRARPSTAWEQDRIRREGIRQDRAAYRRGEKKPPQAETPVGAHDKNLCRCGKPKGIAAKRCYACFRADESKAFQKASRERARLTGKGPARSLESPRRSA